MMDRRSFLRGLVACPVVITTPGLLMPVKAFQTPFAYVSGVWVDGTQFTKTLYERIPAAAVGALDWFDNVKAINEYVYADPNDSYRLPEIEKNGRPHQDKPLQSPRETIPYARHIVDEEYKAWELRVFNKIDSLKLADSRYLTTTIGGE